MFLFTISNAFANEVPRANNNNNNNNNNITDDEFSLFLSVSKCVYICSYDDLLFAFHRVLNQDTSSKVFNNRYSMFSNRFLLHNGKIDFLELSALAVTVSD